MLNHFQNIPIVPLLPYETADSLEINTVTRKPVLARVPLTKNVQSVQIVSNPPSLGKPEESQLPIDLLISTNNQLFNRQVCEFCQFFLHYVQQAITDPKTEVRISFLATGLNNSIVVN